MATEALHLAHVVARDIAETLRTRPQILLAIGAAAALLLCRFPMRSRGSPAAGRTARPDPGGGHR